MTGFKFKVQINALSKTPSTPHLRFRRPRLPPICELPDAVLHTRGFDPGRGHHPFLYFQVFVGFTDARFSQWRDPLAAWLTGLAVLNYFMTGFSSLANAIRQEQVQGTLESVLLTPINLPTVIVASSAWDFVQATLFSFLYLFFGWFFFSVHYAGSFLLALVFLILTTLVLACLGILSASFAMVFKRGDPFGVFLGTGSALFSGVFFPTQL